MRDVFVTGAGSALGDGRETLVGGRVSSVGAAAWQGFAASVAEMGRDGMRRRRRDRRWRRRARRAGRDPDSIEEQTNRMLRTLGCGECGWRAP